MPRTLEPNSPAKRLQYVLKTYANQPWVVAETASVVAMTIGVDRMGQWVVHANDMNDEHDRLVGNIMKFLRTNVENVEAALNEFSDQTITEYLFDLAVPVDSRDRRIKLTGDASEVAKQATQYLVELLSWTPKAQQNHPADAMIPWVAQQVSKLYKARVDGRVSPEIFLDLIDELHKKTNAIAMWAKANRKDIGKVTLEEALRGAADFEVVKSVEQGEVAYKFEDGYTIQMLRTKEQLTDEGEVMQHCVGSYCEQVEEGGTVILSLRDAKGQPHVTMEWVPDWDQILYDKDDPKTHGPGKISMHKSHGDMFATMTAKEFIESPFRLLGHFPQIYGKQNEPPVEKYQQYIREFIQEKFDGMPQAMLMSGADPKDIRFSDRVYIDADFQDLDLSGTDWSRSTFYKVTFDQSDLNYSKFIECEFKAGVRFTPASLKSSQFDRSKSLGSETQWGIMFGFGGSAGFGGSGGNKADLENASFEGVDFTSVDFAGANMKNVLAENAKFLSCDFTGTDLTSASFDHSDMFNSKFQSDVSLKRILDAVIVDGTSFKGTTGVPDWVLEAARGLGRRLKRGNEYVPEPRDEKEDAAEN